MVSDNKHQKDALSLRIEFERLFGLEEVYVGRRTRDGRRQAPAGDEAAPDAGEPGLPSDGPTAVPAGRQADVSAGDDQEARTRARRLAVESARSRVAAREEQAKAEAKPAADAASVEQRYDFTVEDIGPTHDEGLLSDAERAGILRVSAQEGTNAEKLARLAASAAGCARCGLAATRGRVVFGEGDPEAKIVFVGEAPGAEEDKTGRPFVGRAGQLLTKIIQAMGLKRADVYICNVLKCRPPGNRTPAPEEIHQCSPYLREQLAVIRPKVVAALGAPATRTLLDTKEGISKLRGRLFWYRGIPLMPTFHPAYLLRNPHDKGKVWDDMKKLVKFLASRP